MDTVVFSSLEQRQNQLLDFRVVTQKISPFLGRIRTVRQIDHVATIRKHIITVAKFDRPDAVPGLRLRL